MPSRLRRTASWLWTAVDRSRRVTVNVLFLIVVVSVLVAVFGSGKKKMQPGAALVIAPKGRIVEQIGRPSNASLAQEIVQESDGEKETLLRDLVDALGVAKSDPKVSSVYLDVSDLQPSGMTTLEDLRAALLDFKGSGKKVVAYADNYTQSQYYVATTADEVWLSPVGEVSFQGLARYATYFKETLDRLEVDVHVFRVGEFKSAVEPFIRTDASPEAKEADLAWMSQLWSAWLRDVAKARGVSEAALSAYVAKGPELAESYKGDFAKLAVDQKLVDKLGYRDEVTDRMVALAGVDEQNKHERTFRHVAVKAYLDDKLTDRDGQVGGDAVAVIVASGEIVDGRASPGRIGGDTLAELVRKTRNDKKVKAIVLRVDSPGGSAFASEVIRRELVLARKAGKKVVVSMGSVAASGGYWISTASDEIWASPETITGSIGIFGIYPTFDRALGHFLGVHTDGVGTTPFAGQPNPTRPLPEALGRALQQGLDRGYEEFLARVAESRKMSRDAVDKIARGRVWSGADGKRLGLVDQLGGLKDAIASAQKLAGLAADSRVYYPAGKKKWYEGLARELLTDDDARAFARPSLVEQAVRSRIDELERLASLNDPQHLYAWCGCDVR